MLEAIVLSMLILLCVGWAIKLDLEGAEMMDLMGLMFGCIAIGSLLTKMFF